tara:strand:- start:3952 stop:4527 length:576 start_codon:yes stop_codon:yes gene_type:complete
MKVIPISAPVLDNIINDWKADKLKTYNVNTGGDAKYHTSIESLEEVYKKKHLQQTDQGVEKNLDYLFYNKYEKDVWGIIRDDCSNMFRSRKTCTALWYNGPDAFLSWHTNVKSLKGAQSAFLTYVEEEGESFFRYIDDNTGELITDYDKPGWHMRTWTWDTYFWHCIYSNTNRISIGIQCVFKNKSSYSNN